MLGSTPRPVASAGSSFYYEAYASEEAARDRERVLKHDGRSRRALMERIKRHLE
jgi:hypothetical protein